MQKFTGFFYLLSFLLLYFVIFRFKKSDKALNAMPWVLYSFVIVFSALSFLGQLIQLFSLPVTLESFTIGNFLFSVLFITLEVRKNERQHYYFHAKDGLILLLTSIVLLIPAVLFFSSDLLLISKSSDVFRHFFWANDFAKNNVLIDHRMNFHVINAGIALKLAQPWADPFNHYKIFVMCEILFYLLLENLFLMTFIDRVSTWKGRFLLAAWAILFALGYPLNTLFFGFSYFQTGMILLIVSKSILNLIAKDEISFNYGICFVWLLFLALGNSYILFLPFLSMLILLTLIGFIRSCKIDRPGQFIFKHLVQLMGLSLFIFVYYQGNNNAPLTASKLTNDGYIYKEVIRDFIPLIPFVPAGVFAVVRGCRSAKIESSFIALAVSQTVLMFLLGLYGYISPYYVYKNYPLLWIGLFSLAAEVCLSAKTFQKKDRIRVFGVLVGSVFLMVVLTNSFTQVGDPAYFPTAESGIFPVYKENYQTIKAVDHQAERDKYRLMLMARNLSASMESASVPVISFKVEDGILLDTLTGLYPAATSDFAHPIQDPKVIYDQWDISNSQLLIFIDNRENFQLALNHLLHHDHVLAENSAGYLFKK